MKRINVVGTSASGKSTFSRVLAEQLNLSYIELDDLFWLDNWEQASNELFFEKIQKQIILAENGYVIDGNYSRTQEIKWKEIDTIIWLDLPFHLNLFQSVKRTLIRLITKNKLWISSNNTESLKMMLSKDSIIWWMIKTHKKNKAKYLKMMQSNEYQHIHWIHLKSKAEVSNFLKEHQSPK